MNDGNRNVVLTVKIQPDPANKAVLAQMEAEMAATRRELSKPIDITYRPGGMAPGTPGSSTGMPGGRAPGGGFIGPLDPRGPGHKSADWHLNDLMEGIKPGGRFHGAALAGTRGVAGTGAASGAASAGGLGAGGYMTGGAIAAGLFATKFIGEMASDRPNGSYLQSTVQGFANVSNYFEEYYGSGKNGRGWADPFGTERAKKLDQKQAGMERARIDTEIYQQREQQIRASKREGTLFKQNRNADAGLFSALNGIDNDLYSNSRQERLANLYGGNLEGLNTARIGLITNRAQVARSADLARLGNEEKQLSGISPEKRTAEEAQRLAEVLERQRRIKMEIVQETIKSLEATKREREERAQAIREEGMSQQERFGMLESYQQEEVVAARQRLGNGTASIEDQRLLADYGGEETKKLLRDTAIKNSGKYAATFGREIQADAARQDKLAKEVEVKLQEQKEREVKISFENDPEGAAIVDKIVKAVNEAMKKREDKIVKAAGARINANNQAQAAPG